MTKNYELVEHTADLCVRIRARTLAGLFESAGLAVFDIAAEKRAEKFPPPKPSTIKLKAGNLSDLFINWLNELISLAAADGIVFTDISVEEIDERSLRAVAAGSDARNFKMNTEIKAATYHDLSLEQGGEGWMAQVIFDV